MSEHADERIQPANQQSLSTTPTSELLGDFGDKSLEWSTLLVQLSSSTLVCIYLRLPDGQLRPSVRSDFAFLVVSIYPLDFGTFHIEAS